MCNKRTARYGIAGIEPDTRFESRDPLLGPSSKDQRRASVAMRDRQIWTY